MLLKVQGVAAAIAAPLMIVLIFQTYQVSGISCYQCSSEFDPRCADPFDPYSIGMINCSLKPPLDHLPDITPTICRKTTQKVYGQVRVIRECGYIEDPERDDKACARRTGTHDVISIYCSCTTELCNSGSFNWSNCFLIVIAFITALGMTRHNLLANIIPSRL